MPVGTASLHDPRVRLIHEKYFSVRPKPLERWLWSKNVPASAERVFWLHWQEGQLRGDWCSEIPLRRVAQECNLDVSTVTRAYQCLTRLGCIRRTDPGRDATNPFQQATAITEVRIPKELLQVLHQYPNRRSPTELKQPAEQPGPLTEPGRAPTPNHSAAHESECSSTIPQAPSACQAPHSCIETATNSATATLTSESENRCPPTPTEAPSSTEPFSASVPGVLPTTLAATPTTALTPKPITPERFKASTLSPTPQPESPLAALTGRDRAKAIAEITTLLSATERDTYHQSLRLHLPTMSFDPDSKVSAEKRAFLIQVLITLATDDSHTPCNASANTESPSATQAPKAPQRKLSLFHVARLRRDIQSATSSSAAPELLRQVVWSIEAGALRRFSPLHALNIALKKIRAGSWTRPHRMPPNWARSLSTSTSATPTQRTASPHETCSVA